MNKAFFSTLAFLLLINFSKAQESRILSLDFETGITDTFPLPNFDETIESSETTFSIGNFNNEIAQLPEELNELPPGVVFTPRKRAALDFELTDFPLRTNVKIILNTIDGSKYEYSASMVSKKHVLTSTHMFVDFRTEELISSEILVCPAFDNGSKNPLFDCCFVTKIFRFEEWQRLGQDFALLELEQNIGEKTGWVGMGFNNDDDFFRNSLLHKFIYPFPSDWDREPSFFNGDTLYHYFGNLNQIQENRMMVGTSFIGTNGEQGSSIIKIKNRESYTTFGVQNYAAGIAHSRLQNWSFFGLREVIKNSITTSTQEIINLEGLEVFPNPTKDIVNLKNLPFKKIDQIDVFDYAGRRVLHYLGEEVDRTIDLSDLIDGLYLIDVKFERSNKVFKVVKVKY